jgi:Reverse transcriptase (RNA-dependent DNA polymerase)
MVRKKDGGWRPCGNFRRLNLLTSADRYPLPNMADLSAQLTGCSFFTKIDLQKDYLQVLVAVEDIPKTAVITPFGLFEFLRTPFGLKNTGMTFQCLMDSILNGLPYVFVYLDDILIASPCLESHRRHVAEVLRILQHNGLVINAAKCMFGATSVEFLGHLVTASASHHWLTKWPPFAAFHGQTPSRSCRLSWAWLISTGGLSVPLPGCCCHLQRR